MIKQWQIPRNLYSPVMQAFFSKWPPDRSIRSWNQKVTFYAAGLMPSANIRDTLSKVWISKAWYVLMCILWYLWILFFFFLMACCVSCCWLYAGWFLTQESLLRFLTKHNRKETVRWLSHSLTWLIKSPKDCNQLELKIIYMLYINASEAL